MPVTFDSFLPDSGGIATKMVLFGKNFGNDPSLINVYFNKKKATVVGVSDDIMYVLTPRQPGELSDISIVIGTDSVVCAEKQFKYLLSTNVLPYAGVVDANGNGGFKDGPIGEAMFESPRFIHCDLDDNLFISDNENRVRLVSPQLGQVITLADNIARPVGGCTSTDGERVYIGAYVWKASANDRRVYCFDPERQWNPYVIPTGIPASDVDWVSSIAIDEDDVIYFGAENGHLFKVDTKNDQWDYLHQNATRNGDYVYVAYSQIDRRVYVATRDESKIYYYDLKTGEFNYLAGSSKGHNDGPGDEAQFNTIGQIAVDLDGNLIVADRFNHVVRMVRPDGFTSTLAGQPGTAGYLNGLPENALFHEPYGVCVSPTTGAIYVSDKNNYRIRKIVIE
ncbi:IPT/TIG domain-containing protein [Membranicola marinus]|uniref:IPT/TIG domain-containing protein n=1 Tax=Membranihabitans marinus TaxID=1227546 RepID=A0A953L7I2_9BACT|nr:IPT/TIG domain-containing protein [Membranihabitans marinus]MBY5958752.1 IPT/TIG domain-containing protein [Membranihabitans marinus]